MVDSDFDIIPVYHTDAINTDSWLMENPYVNEINEENPYGYTIEMNAAKAKEKGLANGDKCASPALRALRSRACWQPPRAFMRNVYR